MKWFLENNKQFKHGNYKDLCAYEPFGLLFDMLLLLLLLLLLLFCSFPLLIPLCLTFSFLITLGTSREDILEQFDDYIKEYNL